MRSVALAILGGLVLTGCSADTDEQRYRIPSSSMEPTLHCARPAPGCEADEKDTIVTQPVVIDELDRGAIVVFETPTLAQQRCGVGGTFVSRVVGLPGERIELRNDGGLSYVYIDGEQLDEPYIQPNRRDTRGAETFDVPSGHYFVMGDNRSQSCDSREWEGVPANNIHHRVVAIERSSGRVDLR